MKNQRLGMMLGTAMMLSAMLCFGETLQQDPPSAPTPQRVFRVSQGVMTPLHKVNPIYPAQAKAQRIQGDVMLQIRIDREGNVSDLKVSSGPPELVEAAADAVRQWKYKPMTIQGEPVTVQTAVTIRFHL